MTVEEIKDEILTLSRGEKIEIYNWLDYGVVAEFSSRIGADRSLAIRQEIEQKWKVIPGKAHERLALFTHDFARRLTRCRRINPGSR
jgi:hypothetical protein